MNSSEKNTTFKHILSLKHSPIFAHFSKNSTDFIVRERTLYEFSGDGEHLILQICKKDLSTFEALRILSEQTGLKMRDFGYAGLKDKQGLTFQFISMPRKFESEIANFTHEKLKILDTNYHNNKLKIGHLKGNSFFIRLKKVDKINALKLQQAYEKLNSQGFANYFGYQRFGKFNDNFKQGLEILQGAKMKNPKMKDFLISAFQSELFNRYLSKRLEISHFASDFSLSEFASIYKISKDEAKQICSQKQFFKLLNGEVLMHYPFGKCFICEDLQTEIKRFLNKDLSPSGILLGNKTIKPKNESFASDLENEIYKEFYAYESKMNGSRRYLISFLEEAKFSYDTQKAHVILEFFLQKGSYATIVLEELLHTNVDLES